jgi:AraC-like DNA-binding protein
LRTKNFIPHFALREFVACIFTAENLMGKEEVSVYRPFPPSPQNSIIFYVRDGAEIERPDSGKLVKLPPCIFTGQLTERINTKMGKDHLMVYVGFKPGGMYRLLGIPMIKFINDDFNGADLYGSEISEIMEQLNEASNPYELVTIVEIFLISKLKNLRVADSFDLAMQELIRRDGNLAMDEVAHMSCVGFRQFERKCLEKIGIPPKLYARIIRFSKAYRMKEMNAALSWTGLAHFCGYYDQMHLIRDFKEFTGVTPSKMDREMEASVYKLQANLII